MYVFVQGVYHSISARGNRKQLTPYHEKGLEHETQCKLLYSAFL